MATQVRADASVSLPGSFISLQWLKAKSWDPRHIRLLHLEPCLRHCQRLSAAFYHHLPSSRPSPNHAWITLSSRVDQIGTSWPRTHYSVSLTPTPSKDTPCSIFPEIGNIDPTHGWLATR